MIQNCTIWSHWADGRPTLLVDGMKAIYTLFTDHIHAKITFAIQFVLKRYCKDTTGCRGVLFSSLLTEVAHICYPSRAPIVTDKVKTVEKSFSSFPSSASFQPKYVERHEEHAESPSVQKPCPAILIPSATIAHYKTRCACSYLPSLHAIHD